MDPIEQALHRAMVIKCQTGDRAALEELFLRHNRALGYYLHRMMQRDDVGDVQQEVWLAVIRRIGRLRKPESFVVWLYQIARNEAIGRLARNRVIRSLDDEHSDVAEPLDEPDPEFSTADAAEIHRHLAQLSVDHREVLVLRFMEDLSYEQIAGVTNCNVGTVRSRLHYAKQAMRQRLEKDK